MTREPTKTNSASRTLEIRSYVSHSSHRLDCQVLAIRPRCVESRSGYRSRMQVERDELDSLAAEAGRSPTLMGMAALLLALALLLGVAA